MGYIGSHGVMALRHHKYSGEDHSYVAKYILQPFWTRFVTFFPLWMSANLITLTGFMFLLTSVLLGYVYSPQLDTPPPRWVNFAHGLLLFLYQTFDAVDGKQARRTNSSGPLGELFDHGCDALACALEALAFGSTAICGRSTFWFWVISAVPFYFATWEHYFTNTLILPVVNGPTEGLMLIYLMHFLTAFVGADWWGQYFGKSFPFLSWLPVISEIPTHKVALLFMIAFAVIPTVSFNIHTVYKVVQSRKGSMLLASTMLYPFIVLVAGVIIWDYLSTIDMMGTYPHLVIMGTGLAFGFLVGRMVLAHLCDEPKGMKTNMCLTLLVKPLPKKFGLELYCCISFATGYFYGRFSGRKIIEYLKSIRCFWQNDVVDYCGIVILEALLYLPFAIANSLTARLNDGIPLVDEFWVLLGFFVYTVTLYLHFATSVIHEITTALGIYCFRITRKEA